MKLEIEYVDPASLNPFPNNPRDITAKEYGRLAGLLGTYDFVLPIVARREDRMVAGGHQRLKIALESGWAEVPVVFLDGLEDYELAALNVALNNPKAQGSFKLPDLANLLADIDAHGLDAAIATGFDEDALESLITYTPEDLPDPDPKSLNVEPVQEVECPSCGQMFVPIKRTAA